MSVDDRWWLKRLLTLFVYSLFVLLYVNNNISYGPGSLDLAIRFENREWRQWEIVDYFVSHRPMFNSDEEGLRIIDLGVWMTISFMVFGLIALVSGLLLTLVTLSDLITVGLGEREKSTGSIVKIRRQLQSMFIIFGSLWFLDLVVSYMF